AIVRQLLAAGADINARSANGATALHEAVRFDQPGVLGELLRARPRLDTVDREGMHPLALAAALGRLRCLEVLLDGGVAVDLPDRSGLTALYWARRHDRPLAEARLLARGADREAWPLILD
ncbi:MAG: ankyrin repeat domain-containing protein, partial [Dechloromonas sp.]